jgi:outer membrane receptor protein involved in Fe transport
MLNAGDFFGLPLLDSLMNEGTGENYGIEFTIEKFLSDGYYFLVTTSLFNSKYKGYDNVKRNTAYDGEFVVNVLGGYEIELKSRNFITLDTKMVWAGGKRYTPVDVSESIEENTVVWDWERAFERQEEYFRLDFRIGYKVNGKRVSQEWAVDLQNVTGHQNLFMEEYDFEERKVNKVYQQGFVPMMLYRIQF